MNKYINTFTIIIIISFLVPIQVSVESAEYKNKI